MTKNGSTAYQCGLGTEQIEAISLEVCHIEALVELLANEADRAQGLLPSGLMLISNQVAKIQEMLGMDE